MADFSRKKITDLTEKTEPGNNDLFVAGNNGTATMRKMSFANIANGIISKLTGAVSSILSNNLTASRALISNSSGKVAASGVSSTELGYLSGASSNIQSQLSALNSKSYNIISTGDYIAGQLVYMKTGNICVVQIQALKNLPGTASANVATLPVGFRPRDVVAVDTGTPSANGFTTIFRITIAADGVISVYNYGSAIPSAVNIRAQLVFMVP